MLCHTQLLPSFSLFQPQGSCCNTNPFLPIWSLPLCSALQVNFLLQAACPTGRGIIKAQKYQSPCLQLWVKQTNSSALWKGSCCCLHPTCEDQSWYPCTYSRCRTCADHLSGLQLMWWHGDMDMVFLLRHRSILPSCGWLPFNQKYCSVVEMPNFSVWVWKHSKAKPS